MATTSRRASARPAEQPDDRPQGPIEGEVVESTERALSTLASTSAATIDTSMVAILTRAELDQMVVTARANPRSVHQALKATREIACLDMQTAIECGYSLPRGRDAVSGKASVITGASVRLAEIVACQWGNCQAASRVTDVNRAEGYVESEGIFIDFQTNYRVTARVRRSIRGKPRDGKPGFLFSEDMINVTSNAAAAIAFRNAVFKGVPKPIWNNAYEATREIVRGDEKTLGQRRDDLLIAFGNHLRIKPEQVYAILGVAGEKDIGLDELVVAAGFYSALRNNEVTVEDLLREVRTETKAKGLGDAFTGAQGATQTAAEASPVQDKPAPAKPATAAQGAAGEANQPSPDARAAAQRPEPPKLSEEEQREFGILPTPGEADAGEVYYMAGEGWDEDGRRTTYKDGVGFSKAGRKSLTRAYARHPAKPEPAQEQPSAEGIVNDSAAQGELSIRSNPEDRQDPDNPAADDVEAGYGDAETEDGSPGPSVTLDAEALALLDAYRKDVDAAGTWGEIKATLAKFLRTRAYAELPEDEQCEERARGYDRLCVLNDAGSDASTPGNDPQVMSVYLDTKPSEHEARPFLTQLVRSPAYTALPGEKKDALLDHFNAVVMG